MPISLPIDTQQILLVGGGKVASRKLKFIVQYTRNVEIIAEEFCSEIRALIQQYSLQSYQRSYRLGDLRKYDLVFVATDDIDLQQQIYQESQATATLCNFSVACCPGIILPAVVRKGSVQIAISTESKAPALAKALRVYLDKLLPDTLGEIVEELAIIRKTQEAGEARMSLLQKKVQKFMKQLKGETS